MNQLLFVIVLLCVSSLTQASWKVKAIRSAAGTKYISVEKSKQVTPISGKVLLQSLPRYLVEEGKSPNEVYEEYLIDDNHLTPQLKHLAQLKVAESRGFLEDDNVRTLVNQGPVSNRISLTIVGDGYTQAEKDKFFEDALSTTKQLFDGQTYASYLPLFNVYAVFVPSNESGIGDGSPKDTALKLYRSPKGSKRGIMPGDSSAAENAIAMAPGADYPILLANDNYYGGLGGQFAITTSSKRSGIIVLRHELGHNFGNVGEEYDGGQVYMGANFTTRSDSIPWMHWVEGNLKVNNAVNLGGEYVWQNLSGHPYDFNFKFPAGFLFNLQVSTVGWETPQDVAVSIDNQLLNFKGDYNDDRNFYNIGPASGMNAGAHHLHVEEKIHDGDNVLAFARLYAMPTDYDFTKNKVGAYLDYDESDSKVGFRPTHDSCPMRDMLNPNFCVVDKENMWIRFLNRVTLIDDVVVGADKTVTLKVPKLPGLEVAWFKDAGQGSMAELPELRNQLQWSAQNQSGKFKVRVHFATPEVRKPTGRFLTEKSFGI